MSVKVLRRSCGISMEKQAEPLYIIGRAYLNQIIFFTKSENGNSWANSREFSAYHIHLQIITHPN